MICDLEHDMLSSRRVSTALLIAFAAGAACRKSSPEATTAAPAPQWEGEVSARAAAIEKVIADNREGFTAFDSGSLGDATLEMIPYVVYRALQDLEPTVLGDNALNSVGFFPRADLPSGHNGITWTSPTAPDKTFAVRYMTRTCASCHTGRVRLANGTIHLVRGGANVLS